MDTGVGMNVNAETVKNLRKQKLWSQEELALACGLSLRTIQRAEGDGQASAETIKALASVFEIDANQLTGQVEPHQNYLNVQLGYTVIGAVFPVVLIATWSFTQGHFEPAGFLALITICTVVLCLFPSLTTRVEDGRVKWHFGVGLIRKSVSVSRIVSNKPVRNKAWWGIGIRLTHNGWLYNVSGLNAVELILEDGKVVRIGSDEVDAFNQAISTARSSNS